MFFSFFFFVFFLFFFSYFFFFFFFNDTATTEIYTLSLHDALPISCSARPCSSPSPHPRRRPPPDRKSTRLNSSHDQISYAVFCLKKKKKKKTKRRRTKKKEKIKGNAMNAACD